MKAIATKQVNGQTIICPAEEATHLTINLPGPVGRITLPVQIKGDRKDTGNWTWKGGLESPDLKPSILVTSGHFVNGFDPKKDRCWCDFNRENPESRPSFHCHRCHTFVNEGKVTFLSDCSHELRGQTLDLLEVV